MVGVGPGFRWCGERDTSTGFDDGVEGAVVGGNSVCLVVHVHHGYSRPGWNAVWACIGKGFDVDGQLGRRL